LERYLAYQNAKTTLSNKEKEALNLIVSQVNGCIYCHSVHMLISKMNGFTDEQVLDIRRGKASGSKLNNLVALAADFIKNRGRVSEANADPFFESGYNHENLVDIILQVSDKTAMNYLHNLTEVPVDFYLVPSLKDEFENKLN
jgi:hypothetical protein